MYVKQTVGHLQLDYLVDRYFTTGLAAILGLDLNAKGLKTVPEGILTWRYRSSYKCEGDGPAIDHLKEELLEVNPEVVSWPASRLAQTLLPTNQMFELSQKRLTLMT